MLISMTGFGQASQSNCEYQISVEVKTVNNRFLRITTRLPDCIASMEPEIERTVREFAARGTVNVNVRFAPVGQDVRFHLETSVLRNYWQSLNSVATDLGIPANGMAASLLTLPGVVSDKLTEHFDPRENWPLVCEVLTSALKTMSSFRQAEGQVMSDNLRALAIEMRLQLGLVESRSKIILAEYRDKLVLRVSELLQNSSSKVTSTDLVRDVAIYAERADINEEITRLGCHLDQFEKLLADKESQGRRLDFLCQEMLREINTIGSKTADVRAAHNVVEMKLAAERIREILQNVE